MPSNQESVKAKRLADPEFNARYVAQRRAQKARHRARIKADPVKYAKALKSKQAQYRRAAARRTPKDRVNVGNKVNVRNWEASGWSEETIANAMKLQNGCCAICGQPMDKPQPDHEHTAPPKPRALLCWHHNIGMGHFNDDPKLLRAAADYLDKWKVPVAEMLSRPLVDS